MERNSENLTPPLDFSSVTIGVLTALKEEYTACRDVFDPAGDGVELDKPATSGRLTCWLCRVAAKHGGAHVLAISLLPETGNTAAAIAANILFQHCENIRYVIMCGIAGAVPFSEKPDLHVRLGDIVVTDNTGIIQYARGKQRDPRKYDKPEDSSTGCTRANVDPFLGFEFRSAPRAPCPDLLAAVKRLHSDEERLGRSDARPWELTIDQTLQRSRDPRKWKRPPASKDVLVDSPDAKSPKIPHPKVGPRRSGRPCVFHGPIGAADIVQADPRRRDSLRDRYGIKAVEMEGWGVADAAWVANVGYLVIRGTCDYCNSTKSDVWHHYAALIAAAYTRSVIEYLHPIIQRNTRPLEPKQPFPTPTSIPAADLARVNPRHSETIAIEVVLRTTPVCAFPTEPTLPIDLASVPTMVTPAPVPAPGDLTAVRDSIPGDLVERIMGPHIHNVAIDHVVALTEQVDALMKQARWTEVDPLATELEKQLRLLPRRGSQVRTGWIRLAQLESTRQQHAKLAGKPANVERLSALRKEAVSVVV